MFRSKLFTERNRWWGQFEAEFHFLIEKLKLSYNLFLMYFGTSEGQLTFAFKITNNRNYKLALWETTCQIPSKTAGVKGQDRLMPCAFPTGPETCWDTSATVFTISVENGEGKRGSGFHLPDGLTRCWPQRSEPEGDELVTSWVTG